jgi:esterase/lipase superfamily enzyme
VIALLAGGGAYVSSELQGEHADYTAPEDQPMLTTRGRLDGSPTVERDGEWTVNNADADAVVLFVHGFDTGPQAARDQSYTLDLGLSEYRDLPVVGYSWDSDVEWEPAKDNANANAAPLADWLGGWADDGGQPIHLIGYSLGARVVGETLRELHAVDRTDTLASVSLLGGAIPADSVERDARYGEAISAVDAPVTNFYSGRDRVLGWVYRLSDRTKAVGSVGIADSTAAPDGYQDVAVTDLVGDHYSYFEPEDGCLNRVAENLD